MRLVRMFCLISTLTLFSIAAQGERPGGGKSGTIIEPRAIEAREDLKPHVALKGGVTTFEDGYNSSGSLGLEAGIQAYIPFGVAIEGSLTDQSTRGRGDSASSISRAKLLAKGSYHFGGANKFIRYTYLGAMAGAVFDEDNASSRASFGWGPTGGFDLPVSSFVTGTGVTLGLGASYLFVADNASDNFNLDGVIKYWF